MRCKRSIWGILILTLLFVSGWTEGFSPVLRLKYARHFKVEYVDKGCKKVTDATGNQILLVSRGSKIPAGYHHITVIRTPVQKALFMSMTQVCLLRPFHNSAIWASVAGVSSPLEEWYIPEIRKGLQNGSIQFVGDGYQPDYEKIQAIQPEVVFTFGGPNGQLNLMQKLSELNIPYVVDNEYLEADPLGQMEWIKFIAAFYNQEEAAGQYFDQAESRIKETARMVQGKRRPKIAWGMIYNGKVYVPAGNSYVAKMVALAGGDFIFKKITRSNSAMSIESFYALSRNADILINSAYSPTVPSVKVMLEEAPILEDLKAVRRGQVWCLQPWYNQMLDQNDQILLDLASIFHPEVIRNRSIENFLKVSLQ
ncbi:MAG TPA: ABC transporter substrate-binding protein [Firmicutes bacterium]|nr:ABC transporter substrate-binding protein [Bacillota bacterium]